MQYYEIAGMVNSTKRSRNVYPVGVQEMEGLRSTSLSTHDEGGAGHTAMIYHFLSDIFCTLVIFRSFSFPSLNVERRLRINDF